MSTSPANLAPAYDAALPKDAPGAWIRAAIERMQRDCGRTRPGTLGYQHCQLERGHDGEHRSQDRETWADPVIP